MEAQFLNQGALDKANLQAQLLNQGFQQAQAAAAADLQAQQGLGAYQSQLGQSQQAVDQAVLDTNQTHPTCLLYTSPSPRDRTRARMPSSA